MYGVIRHFSGTQELASELKRRNQEVESLIRGVPGVVAYYLLETSDGIASVTICETRAGCDESTQRATSYIREKLPNLKVGAPEIIMGDVTLKVIGEKARA